MAEKQIVSPKVVAMSLNLQGLANTIQGLKSAEFSLAAQDMIDQLGREIDAERVPRCHECGAPKEQPS